MKYVNRVDHGGKARTIADLHTARLRADNRQMSEIEFFRKFHSHPLMT